MFRIFKITTMTTENYLNFIFETEEFEAIGKHY